METAEIRLRNNLKMLKRLGEQTKDIIESKNERKWQRHQSNLETKLNDTHALITSIVELKIAENIEEEVINEWSKEQESALEHFEHMLDELDNILTLGLTEQEKAARKQQEIDEREAE
ncbi:Hypothetical predicted protein [Paramuricea clavata]|uniref:Uncharacterized protein n=1 Tax=Paramuricea clavata TaxID=317549 RepID=A0A6S7JKQ0_PARCT|nr:Hypothetical predicted protein [Paramuricea clavata]